MSSYSQGESLAQFAAATLQAQAGTSCTPPPDLGPRFRRAPHLQPFSRVTETKKTMRERSDTKQSSSSGQHGSWAHSSSSSESLNSDKAGLDKSTGNASTGNRRAIGQTLLLWSYRNKLWHNNLSRVCLGGT